MGDIPHAGGSLTRSILFNDSNFDEHENNKLKSLQKFEKNNSICHICFCYGHIASECANNLENIKKQDFNFKCDNINNDFSSFVASSKESSKKEINSYFDDLIFEKDGDSEINYDKKFLDLMKDYALKRKENSEFLTRIIELEKEVKFLKQNLCESENEVLSKKSSFLNKLDIVNGKLINSEIVRKDLEIQITILTDNLGESEKKADFQRTDFLEKLSAAQSKFLLSEKARKDLENKLIVSTSEIENYKKLTTQFTNGSQGLDKLLGIGKSSRDRTGLGFVKGPNIASSSQTTFVKPTVKVDCLNVTSDASFSKDFKVQKPSDKVFKNSENKIFKSNFSVQRFIPICHHCGVVGHIRPKCFKLLNVSSSFKTSFEKSKFFVEKSPISKESLNSKGPKLLKSKFNFFDKNRNTSTCSSTSHKKFVPTCHLCGCKGHIRPRCFKLGNLNANLKMNLADKVDMLMCEVERLRKPRAKRFAIDLNDTKRMAYNTMWVRKDRSNFKTAPISKLNDFSGFKILKRGDGFQRLN